MGKFIDLTGQRFGRLTALEIMGRNKQNKILWKCKCDCGVETVVSGNSLRKGTTKSCGCLQREKVSINAIGQKFGRLTVIEKAEKSKNGNYLWKCRCDCGNESIVRYSDLKSGSIKSCGCLKIESSKLASITHGGRYERLYKILDGIKERCNNPNNHDYKNYGGRGITICDDWLKSYSTFREWAITNGYKENLTIDRKDVDGNYEPSNCRWATDKEQANNRRNNHRITYKGKTMTIAEWSETYNISITTLHYRIKSGWPIRKALTAPIQKHK